MSAQDVDKDNVGRVVPAPELGYQLARFIQQETYSASIQIVDNTKVHSVTHLKDGVDVSLTRDESEQSVSAKLLILADGGRSDIAEQVGLNKSHTDYQQSAILANVVADQGHMNCAYERFTDTGPIALLPLTKHYSSLMKISLSNYRNDLVDEQVSSRLLEKGKAIQCRHKVEHK